MLPHTYIYIYIYIYHERKGKPIPLHSCFSFSFKFDNRASVSPVYATQNSFADEWQAAVRVLILVLLLSFLLADFLKDIKPLLKHRHEWSTTVDGLLPYLLRCQSFPASVFLVHPTATHHQLDEPLAPSLLFTHANDSISYLSTNPRFPPHNLVHIQAVHLGGCNHHNTSTNEEVKFGITLSIIISFISLAIRQCAAWSSTLITHNFPERRTPRKQKETPPCTESTSLLCQHSACLLHYYCFDDSVLLLLHYEYY